MLISLYGLLESKIFCVLDLYYMEIYTIGVKDRLRMLRRVAQPLESIDGSTAKLAQDMIETMIKGKGIGLAGPQVGLLQRIFTVKIGTAMPLVFINPVITATSPETACFEEGCLSIPEQYAEVKRPKSVQIQAWNEKGRPFTVETDGLLATVIQHELDHLNGILFLDHISPVKRKRILGQFNIKLKDYPEVE